MRYLFFVLVSMVFIGCPPSDPPHPPIPITPSDPSGCREACTHLQEMECEEGDPLVDGTSCEVFCRNTLVAGHDLSLECVMGTTTCEEFRACP